MADPKTYDEETILNLRAKNAELKADLRISNHLFAVATDKQRELDIEIMQLRRMNAELKDALRRVGRSH